MDNSSDQWFIIVHAFAPLITTEDHVVKYIKDLKNGKIRGCEYERLSSLLLHPLSITDELIWNIIDRMINDYDADLGGFDMVHLAR